VRRALCFVILILLSSQAQASPIGDFVSGYATTPSYEHGRQVYEICGSLLSTWPDSRYRQGIEEASRLSALSPEASYFLISSCQALWESKYLDLKKAEQIKRRQTGDAIAIKLSQGDLAGFAHALSDEIRIFNDVYTLPSKDIPPAPYEILIGQASADRDLDEHLNQELALAIGAIGTAGGMTAQVLQTTKEFGVLVSRGSAALSRTGAEAALLITAVSWGAAEVANYGQWWVRQRDLWNNVSALAGKLAQSRSPGVTSKNQAPLLDEFYSATERLGYFYSYQLFLSDSGGDTKVEGNAKCFKQLDDYFSGRPANDFAAEFASAAICPDAGTVGLGASLYIGGSFPNDPNARLVAARLMAKAKRTVWKYREMERYNASLPVCDEVQSVFPLTWGNCHDPKTGDRVL
jgi:hypothetical protein